MRYLYLPVLVFILLLAIVETNASPRPLIKPAPGWILKRNPAEPKVKDREVTDGYYISLHDDQANIALETYYSHKTRSIINETGGAKLV